MVTLGFESQERKEAFLAQFLDGWGEGVGIQVEWDEDEECYETDFLAMEHFDDGENSDGY